MGKPKRHRLEQLLAEVDIRVSRGQRLVKNQMEAIEERRRGGFDVKRATSLLETLEQSLQLHTEACDRVRHELAQVTAGDP